ncbi:MAG TPA: hypothetical protein VHF26_08555 [Trebonia sp.]|nr:hypothetical protein [Trebonia sp.]
MARLRPWPSGPTRDERPERPFTGYKLAHAVLSADGTRTGFAGLTLGATRVYGVVADAECVWNRRHAPPRRWCGCGFYCLHDLTDARSLACATENRPALLLEVSASGRYIRYERGLRYSRQRVRAILDAQCGCGRPGAAVADAGSGVIGWRHLAPVCGRCAAGRPTLTLSEFTARLDGSVRVAPLLSAELLTGPESGPGRAAAGPADTGLTAAGLTAAGPANGGPAGPGQPPATGPRAGTGRPAGTGHPADPGKAVNSHVMAGAEESPIAVLTAEIALLHARLDDLQSRLDR